jgi:hypothetical protein
MILTIHEQDLMIMIDIRISEKVRLTLYFLCKNCLQSSAAFLKLYGYNINDFYPWLSYLLIYLRTQTHKILVTENLIFRHTHIRLDCRRSHVHKTFLRECSHLLHIKHSPRNARTWWNFQKKTVASQYILIYFFQAIDLMSTQNISWSVFHKTPCTKCPPPN